MMLLLLQLLMMKQLMLLVLVPLVVLMLLLLVLPLMMMMVMIVGCSPAPSRGPRRDEPGRIPPSVAGGVLSLLSLSSMEMCCTNCNKTVAFLVNL